MRIAISTDGDHVTTHFGRCPSYTIIDIDDGKIVNRESVDNPGHMPGAIPKFLHQKGVEAIITGGIGVRAINLFNELGIQAIMGIQGTIDKVIKDLSEGRLEGGESLCSPGSGKGYGLDKAECDHEDNENSNKKVLVSSLGDSLDSQIDPRFGRSQYFIIVDVDNLDIDVIENPNKGASGGAGVQSGQIAAEKQVKAVLTGNVGPNAFQTLQSAGIDVITGVSGTVKEAVERYKKGEFKLTESPTSVPKSGLRGR